MTSPYPADFIDTAGNTRLEGMVDFTDPANQPGGGGAPPVGVFLRVTTAMEIHDSGPGYPIKWDNALDDPWSFNTLTSLPAGLGIDTHIDGSDGTLTTTEAGVWAFTLVMGVNPDASWVGTLHLDDNTIAGAIMRSAGATTGALATVTEVVNYPAGAVTVPTVITQVAATANPYNVFPTLSIVRLG